MSYRWHENLKRLFERTVRAALNGKTSPKDLFDPAETQWLATLGARPIDVFDAADDCASGGDPDWETFLLVSTLRRDYFHQVQKGRWAQPKPDSAFPPKHESLDGIEWLPRILAKARARLRGELPESLMYGCGGDRAFLRRFDVHPADFLRRAWEWGGDDGQAVAFLRTRSTNKPA